VVRARRSWLLLALVAGCDLRSAESRALADLAVGRGEAGGVAFAAEDGLAHIRSLAPGALELWAAAPRFVLRAVTDADAVESWTVAVENCMPDARLDARAGAAALAVVELERPSPTRARWRVDLPAGAEVVLEVAPADAAVAEAWRFAVVSDIQEALAEADSLFAAVAADPGVRFVASTGDLIDRPSDGEYDLLDRQRGALPVPFFSTIGNHELYGDIDLWADRYGRCSVHFDFKGASFSLVDSADATIDPLVYEWLDGWLDDAAARVHVFLTHIPPIDPVGVRAGAFRSRAEAHKLLGRLAAGGVDLTIYGHIHSLYWFDNAGIPAVVSGGGGAWPERWDGVGRHFLAVDVAPGGIVAVTAVPVD
jgi:hypothetical protein